MLSMTEPRSAVHMYGNSGASMHETRGPSTALMYPEVFHKAISVFMQRPEVSMHEAKIISMQKARGYRHESKCTVIHESKYVYCISTYVGCLRTIFVQ